MRHSPPLHRKPPANYRRSARLLHVATILGVLAISLACTQPSREGTMPGSRENVNAGQPLDENGVAKLLSSAPGVHFHLGKDNPNSAGNLQIERKTPALRRTDGALEYWNVAAHDLDYASGGSGKTSRLHIYAGAGRQAYTWKTQKGFLATPSDIRNQEFTVFVRVHGIVDPQRAAITLKIRGGAHSANNPDLASCTMMTFQAASTGAVARFGKELIHPIYDYVKLPPGFAAALVDNQWFGLKLLSYGMPDDSTRVVNRLYLDSEPFERQSGKPRNRWQLFAEYVDSAGLSTGRYSKLADWGGWQTTLRTDGVGSLDFTMIGLREIQPPKWQLN